MNVDIIGRGNVAVHLEHALSSKHNARIINPHTLKGLRNDADVVLVSVSDSAIASVAASLIPIIGKHTVIAHTSGTTEMSILECTGTPTGVFYPLQTFSKATELRYDNIPIFIEGSDTDTTCLLTELARSISTDVRYADSEQRRKLHLAAVLSCNFVNHLWALSDRILQEAGYEFSVMLPLLQETLQKASANPPATVQTGPAARRDKRTMNAHLDMLAEYPEIARIYSMLSDSIMCTSSNSKPDKNS